MLDRRFILENPQLVQENCDHRGVKVDVGRFVELESQRRKLQADVEELSRQANLVSKSIGQAKDAGEREAR
jgi:seryl-tRNA synthetase